MANAMTNQVYQDVLRNASSLSRRYSEALDCSTVEQFRSAIWADPVDILPDIQEILLWANPDLLKAQAIAYWELAPNDFPEYSCKDEFISLFVNQVDWRWISRKLVKRIEFEKLAVIVQSVEKLVSVSTTTIAA